MEAKGELLPLGLELKQDTLKCKNIPSLNKRGLPAVDFPDEKHCKHRMRRLLFSHPLRQKQKSHTLGAHIVLYLKSKHP